MTIMTTDAQGTIKPYPIQAKYISVRELYIKANILPSESVSVENTEPQVLTGSNPYNAAEKTIQIGIKITMGSEDETAGSPFHLRVELAGEFLVNESLFPLARLDEWVRTNVLYIFHPYLREYVYSLTARCGFKPVLLPLVEVPIFSIIAQPTEG